MVEASTSEPTETREEALPGARQNTAIADHEPSTATDWVRMALRDLRLAPHSGMVSRVLAWLAESSDRPSCTRSAIAAAMTRLQKEEHSDATLNPEAA